MNAVANVVVIDGWGIAVIRFGGLVHFSGIGLAFVETSVDRLVGMQWVIF